MAKTVANSGGHRNGIQALRAIACLSVLVQHVTVLACYTKGLDFKNYLAVNFGDIGVFLFFVISGFVMGECLNQGVKFIWNRAIRIYPPYWIAIGLSWLMLRNYSPDWHVDLLSSTLSPSTVGNETLKIPYWTLCYEVAFYFITYVFVMLNLTKKQISSVCIGWLILIAGFDIYGPAWGVGPTASTMFVPQPGLWILLSPVSTFFVLGLFASTSGTELIERIPTTYLALVAVMFIVIGSRIPFATIAPSYIISAVGYVFAVVWAKKSLLPKILVKIGDFSYGLYLVHMIIIMAVAYAIQPYATHIRFMAVWSVLAICSLTGGLLFGWFEYFLHKKIFRRKSPKNPDVNIAAAA